MGIDVTRDKTDSTRQPDAKLTNASRAEEHRLNPDSRPAPKMAEGPAHKPVAPKE